MDTIRLLLDRYPFNSPWIRTVVARHWLATWFVANAIFGFVPLLQDERYLFADARLYLYATDVWLAGENPWTIQLDGNYFAAPPPSLLPLVPFALLPDPAGVILLSFAGIVAGIMTVRLLRLPAWWMLFPPLVQSMIAGNGQTLLLPLILINLGPLAVLFKIYAVVPLVILGRWRSVLGTVLLLVLTIPILPWPEYIAGYASINEHLQQQTRFALPTVVLVLASPFALVAMWIVGRQRSAWLAVPALWPSQQYYYGSLAMGAKSNIAAAIVAFPISGSGLWALLVLALVEWRRGVRPTAPMWWSQRRRGTIGTVTPRTGPIDSEP
jgi:hypothetical protein